jgi:hypothetical protein
MVALPMKHYSRRAACYKVHEGGYLDVWRLNAFLLAVASLTAGTRDLPDQTIEVPKTRVLFTKLKFQHGMGVWILHGEIVNQGTKDVTGLRFVVVYSDRNGVFTPARGPAHVTADDAPPNAHLKFTIDVAKDASGRRIDADTLSLVFKYDPDPNRISPLDVDSLVALGCPVQMLKVDPVAVIFGTPDPWGFEMKITYRNISAKTIVAEKFGASFFDVTRDGERSAWDYTSAIAVAPNAVASSHWGDGIYVNELGLRLKAEAWPIKLIFSDGTAWQDDGKQKCKSAAINRPD